MQAASAPALSSPLNPAQLELLKILSIPMSDSDMADLKAKLIEFLSERLTKEVDAAFKAKGYTKEIYKTWKKEHMRRRANPIKFEA